MIQQQQQHSGISSSSNIASNNTSPQVPGQIDDHYFTLLLSEFPQHFHVDVGQPTDQSGPADVFLVRPGKVGGGSGGRCYVARRLIDGLRTVVKIIDMTECDAKQLERAQAERAIHLKMQHFAVIRTFANFVNEKVMVIAMELAEGGDLAYQISQRASAVAASTTGQQQQQQQNAAPLVAPFRESEVALCLVQVVLALQYLHSKSTIHRDLKSSNLFVKGNGLVKLGDFGLSREFDPSLSLSDNVGTSIVGTPFYLAPELWHKNTYSKKVDMWCLGVIAYEMLMLRRPFDARGILELRDAVLSRRMRPLSGTISQEMKDVVESLLQLDPSMRPDAIAILQRPVMRYALYTFEALVASVCDAQELQSIVPDIAAARTEMLRRLRGPPTASTPAFTSGTPPPPPPADCSITGPVIFLQGGKWKRRAVSLDRKRGDLRITRAAAAASATDSPSGPGDGGGAEDGAVILKIPLARLVDALLVPQSFMVGELPTLALIHQRGESAAGAAGGLVAHSLLQFKTIEEVQRWHDALAGLVFSTE